MEENTQKRIALIIVFRHSLSKAVSLWNQLFNLLIYWLIYCLVYGVNTSDSVSELNLYLE